MAYNQIKTLLNKKGWTGRELGIIEITNMCSVFTQRMQGVDPPIPIVTKAQFQSMLNGLQDSYQGRIYNGYISIHEWLSLYYNISNSNTQQAQLQFKALGDTMQQALQAEDVYNYIESLPVIMTRKQYEEEMEKGRRAWLIGPQTEDDPYRCDNLIGLVYRAFEYYAEQLTKNPSKPNPLKPIRKKYLAERISSPIIKERYNEAVEYGYYFLEDGRRSDQMSEEEWQEAITTPKMKEMLRREDLAGNLAGTAFPGHTIADIADYNLMQRANILYRGGSNLDADMAEKDRYREAGLGMPVHFELYDDLPPDLNKWDFLMEATAVYEVYGCLGGGCDDAEWLEDLEDFVAEFADMVQAMLQDISKTVYAGEKDFSSLPLSEWAVTTISWLELYERDLYGMRAETDRVDILFDGNKRAMFNGIAIIDPESAYIKPRSIDDQGYYHPPEIRHSFSSHSLQAYFPEAEHYAEKVDELERGREALLDSWYFLKAYNLALDLIAEHFEIPDIVCFKAPVAGIEAKIDALNELVPILYLRIRDIAYEDEELKQKKLQVLQDIFTEIDYKSIEIPAEKIEQVKASFADFQAFKDGDLADILFYREASSEEVGDDE